MNSSDTSMHVLQAVASIGALGRENDQLIKATAKQAATIRTLTERNSSLEAEVNLAQYNVEFLKAQGRKTRLKLRDAKKAAKINRVDQACVEELRTSIKDQDATIRSKNIELRNAALEMASLKASIERIQDGRELPFTIQIDRYPFKVARYADIPKPRYFNPGEPISIEPVKHFEMMQVAVVQSAIQLQVAPEHHRDAASHLHFARKAAAELTRGVEQQILDAIRGKPTPVKDLEWTLLQREMQSRLQQSKYPF